MTPLPPDPDPDAARPPVAGHPSRRDFAKTLATAAAAAPLLAGAAACAPSPAQSAAPVPAVPVEEPGDPVAAALTEVVRLRFGTRLSVRELERVRRGIEGNLRAARTLRAFDLPIGTEPATVFRAFRGGAG